MQHIGGGQGGGGQGGGGQGGGGQGSGDFKLQEHINTTYSIPDVINTFFLLHSFLEKFLIDR